MAAVHSLFDSSEGFFISPMLASSCTMSHECESDRETLYNAGTRRTPRQTSRALTLIISQCVSLRQTNFFCTSLHQTRNKQMPSHSSLAIRTSSRSRMKVKMQKLASSLSATLLMPSLTQHRPAVRSNPCQKRVILKRERSTRKSQPHRICHNQHKLQTRLVVPKVGRLAFHGKQAMPRSHPP